MRRASIKRARINEEEFSEPSKGLRGSTLKALRLQLSSSKLVQNDILDWSETPAATARKSGKRLVLFASDSNRDSKPSTARSSTCGWDDLPFEMYLCKHSLNFFDACFLNHHQIY
jgi:hypothetical protein